MLSKNQLRSIQSLQLKKNREESGLFIVEGEKSVLELINAGNWEVDSIFAVDTFVTKFADLPGQVTIVTGDDLKKLSGLHSANTVLAVAKQKKGTLDNLLKGLSIVLDDIRDPGNLGTIIRIADWFGVENVICSNSTVDLYNPKTIQATMGSFLRVNVVYTDIKKLIEQNQTNVPVYATVLNGENIYKENLPENAWIVMGNEANGISEEIKSLIKNHLTIPSFSQTGTGAESLNAAIATAVICSEWRARKFKV
jgi:TrmH family RNA methyltransferase